MVVVALLPWSLKSSKSQVFSPLPLYVQPSNTYVVDIVLVVSQFLVLYSHSATSF